MRTIAVVTLLVACHSASPPPAAPKPASAPPPTASPPPPPAPVVAAVFPGTPATAAGRELSWVLDGAVNRHGKIERAEIEAHFAPSFLAQVPVDKVLAVSAQLGDQMADLVIDKASGGELKLVAHVTTHGKKLRVILDLDATTKQIVGLLFQPDVELGPKPTSYEDADKLIGALAPHAQLLVASVDKGTCKPIHALNAREELAIGSAFKLYVLLGLADRMIAGTSKWDDQLAVRDDWKSLPSGVTQNDKGGTQLTIQTFAERMISISDNTATDHLLYTVGRKPVEAALREAKHAHPELDTPFLSTRELFLLKLVLPAADVDGYIAMTAAKRRDYLDKTLAGKPPTLDNLADWKGARKIDKLEWFASSEDLCRVMGTLWTRAQNPKAAPLLDVLAKNPGLPVDKKVFPYVGYKGGSEPGVIDLTWLLRRDDDKWFVVSLTLNAAEGGEVEEEKIVGVATGVVELLAKDRK